MPLLQPPAPDLRSSELTYTHAYNSIVSRVHRASGSGSGGVVILAGVDVVSPAVIFFPSGDADDVCNQDGLLAARILSTLFKQDDVPYRLVPVGGYSELEAKRDEALASEEVSYVQFIWT
jgi:cell division control protein 45